MITFPQINRRRDRNARPFAARVDPRCDGCHLAAETLRSVRTSTATLHLCDKCRCEHRDEEARHEYIRANGFRPSDRHLAAYVAAARFRGHSPYNRGR